MTPFPTILVNISIILTVFCFLITIIAIFLVYKERQIKLGGDSMLKPTSDNVVFEMLEEEKEETEGGIVLPNSVEMDKTAPLKAKVVAVGPGRYNEQGERIKPSVSKGDIVLLPQYSGHIIKHEGEEYLLGSEKDVLAMVG